MPTARPYPPLLPSPPRDRPTTQRPDARRRRVVVRALDADPVDSPSPLSALAAITAWMLALALLVALGLSLGG